MNFIKLTVLLTLTLIGGWFIWQRIDSSSIHISNEQLKDKLEKDFVEVDKSQRKSKIFQEKMDTTNNLKSTLKKDGREKLHKKVFISNNQSLYKLLNDYKGENYKLFNVSKTVIKQELRCLETKRCSPNFAHLQKALALKVLILEHNPAFANELDLSSIYGIIQAGDDAHVEKLALEVVRKNKLDDESFLELMDNANLFNNKALGSLYRQLQNASKSTPVRRTSYLKSLAKSFIRLPASEKIGLVNEIVKLRLDKEEFLKISPYACGELNEKDKNWKKLAHAFGRFADSHGMILNIKQFCNI